MTIGVVVRLGPYLGIDADHVWLSQLFPMCGKPADFSAVYVETEGGGRYVILGDLRRGQEPVENFYEVAEKGLVKQGNVRELFVSVGYANLSYDMWNDALHAPITRLMVVLTDSGAERFKSRIPQREFELPRVVLERLAQSSDSR